MDKVSIYNDIYERPEKQINEIIGQVNKGGKDGSDEFMFEPEINLIDLEFLKRIFWGINKTYSGQFTNILKTNEFLQTLKKETDFNDNDLALNLIEKIYNEIYLEQDKAHKKMKNPKKFLNYLYGLDYLDAAYNLKVGGKDLIELSLGERGIVLNLLKKEGN